MIPSIDWALELAGFRRRKEWKLRITSRQENVPVLGRCGREGLCVKICLSLRHAMKYAMEYTIVIVKVPVCAVKRAVHLPNSLVL